MLAAPEHYLSCFNIHLSGNIHGAREIASEPVWRRALRIKRQAANNIELASARLERFIFSKSNSDNMQVHRKCLQSLFLKMQKVPCFLSNETCKSLIFSKVHFPSLSTWTSSPLTRLGNFSSCCRLLAAIFRRWNCTPECFTNQRLSSKTCSCPSGNWPLNYPRCMRSGRLWPS